ncbi:MAG TPA: hypothetical protein VGU20_07495 [Stellaceae bacterium]|nr:hypothetical protein [Stellaceae bacterium]
MTSTNAVLAHRHCAVRKFIELLCEIPPMRSALEPTSVEQTWTARRLGEAGSLRCPDRAVLTTCGKLGKRAFGAQ